MPKLRIPTPLRPFTEGQNEVIVRGGTVGEAMHDLVKQYPAIRPHLFNGNQELRPFVNLFLGEDNIRELQGVETPLDEDDKLLIIPSIAGGS